MTLSLCSDEMLMVLAYVFWKCYTGYQEVCFQVQLLSKSGSIKLDNHTILQHNWEFQSWPSSHILKFIFF